MVEEVIKTKILPEQASQETTSTPVPSNNCADMEAMDPNPWPERA